MLFLDVTQSCRSSNNSGIQVVTRNLFRELAKVIEITPMIWDARLRRYAKLSQNELNTLANPFPKGYRPRSRPNKEENPVTKELLATLLRLGRQIPLSLKPSENDLLLFPEVFRDNRVLNLSKRLHPELRKTGVFYDANVMRNPKITPVVRTRNFHAYLDFLASCKVVSCISKESEHVFREHCKKNNASPEIGAHSLPAESPPSPREVPVRDPPLILYVSTLAYNKNHLPLLTAAEELWNENLHFELNLIGQADPSWTPRVTERLQALASKGHPVHWLRHIDQDTLERSYAASLFTVYPSSYEGCGLPILESLVRGKPCLCGDNGALGEITKGGGCLTIKEQHNPDNLADGMRKLLLDANLRRKLSREALARDCGTWKNYAFTLLNFLEAE
jgi:glycosyltransferase involved in cell wall biosynthesis